jgi:transposase
MSRSAIQPHLDKEQLQQKMSEAQSLDQFKRWQTIYLRLTQPDLSIQNIADACNVQYRTVTQWTWLYNKFGPNQYALAGRGGRRNALLDPTEEKRLLEELQSKAEKGQIVAARTVQEKAQKVLGRNVSKDYAYDLLHRHQWRKVQPRPRHPKADKEKQEDFKKTSKPCWLPPEKN